MDFTSKPWSLFSDLTYATTTGSGSGNDDALYSITDKSFGISNKAGQGVDDWWHTGSDSGFVF